jgi:hypothetical protein
MPLCYRYLACMCLYLLHCRSEHSMKLRSQYGYAHTQLRVNSRSGIWGEHSHGTLLRHSSANLFALNMSKSSTDKILAVIALLFGFSPTRCHLKSSWQDCGPRYEQVNLNTWEEYSLTVIWPWVDRDLTVSWPWVDSELTMSWPWVYTWCQSLDALAALERKSFCFKHVKKLDQENFGGNRITF